MEVEQDHMVMSSMRPKIYSGLNLNKFPNFIPQK